MKKAVFLFTALGLFVPQLAAAHCPLCTIGAGLAATGAALLGVKAIVIGVFIGAFALALGLWLGRIIKKTYIPYQKQALAVLSFAATVFPIQPLFQDYASIYISFAGNYGSLLNRTYAVDTFLAGSVVGALILIFTPKISSAITRARGGKTFAFQGMLLILVFLSVVSAIMQIL